MPYRLKRADATVESSLRRIACEQIDRAAAELADDRLTQAETVHQVRKRMKKVRGLIRLVRPGLAPYKAENRALRDAGRRLSALRDSKVLLDTHAALIDHSGLDGRSYRAVRDALERAAEPGLSSDAGDTLTRLGQDLMKVRERAAEWTLVGVERKILGKGVKKTFKRARNAMARARESRRDADFHEWRKRVKYHWYHWYHCRLLRDVFPPAFADRIDPVGRPADLLGTHHDLAVYAAKLDTVEPPEGRAHLFGELVGFARDWQSELERSVVDLGNGLFGITPARMQDTAEAGWQERDEAA